MIEDQYKTIKRRCISAFVDGCIVLLLAFVIAMPVRMILSWSIIDILRFSIPVFGFFVFVVVPVLTGSTPAKRIFGLRIIAFNSQNRLGFFQAAIREPLWSIAITLALAGMTVMFLSGSTSGNVTLYVRNLIVVVTIWYAFDLSVMLLSNERRSLRDIIASTVVVKNI